MPRPIVIVLDLGTQSVRAGAVSVEGDILAISQAFHEVSNPQPGWAQQRPAQWWENACRALRELATKVDFSANAPAAFAACGQMHGPVGVTEDGALTTEWTQIWCDKRCQEQCDALLAHHDENELARLTGNPVQSGWVSLKVRWIAEHRPDVYARTRWFLVPKDFINYRMTGVAATDPSEASGTYLWDATTDAYSDHLAELVGVDLKKFAPVHRAAEIIGAVTDEAAVQTGLPAGLPVIAGGADFIVSMLGLGLTEQGAAADITGTSTLFMVHLARPLVAPGFSNLRHVVGGWLPFTMLDCGGLANKWALDFIASAREASFDYDRLVALAEQAPPGSDGLMFYPYPLGERRRENTAARGAFYGLTLNHRAPHLARAVMEGVAMAVGQSLCRFAAAGVEITRVYAAGGGTRNRLLNQIKADVYGVPLELTDEPEAGVKGLALLGAQGAGLIDDAAATARARAKSFAVIEPDPARVDFYRRQMDEFQRMYDHLLGYWSGAS